MYIYRFIYKYTSVLHRHVRRVRATTPYIADPRPYCKRETLNYPKLNLTLTPTLTWVPNLTLSPFGLSATASWKPGKCMRTGRGKAWQLKKPKSKG